MGAAGRTWVESWKKGTLQEIPSLILSEGISHTRGGVPAWIQSSWLHECGRQNNGPKGVHVLRSETCEYVTFHGGKKDFADVTKLRMLRWGD